MIVVKVTLSADRSVVEQLPVFPYDAEAYGEHASACESVIVRDIPLHLSVKDLRRIFGRFGSVENAKFVETSAESSSAALGTCRVAVVTFKTKGSARLLLRRSDCDLNIDYDGTFGMAKWRKEYMRRMMPKKMTKEEADEILQKCAQNQDKRRRGRRAAAVADEDGWITVTRNHSQCFVADKSSSSNVRLKFRAAGRRKKVKKDDYMPFYRFQMKESKRKQVEELQRKFEADKKRIKLMLESRKFNPY